MPRLRRITHSTRSCLHVYPGFADPPGYRSIRTLKTIGPGALGGAGRPPSKLTWKDLVDRGYVIVHGRIAVEGRSAEELNNNELIKKFYLGL